MVYAVFQIIAICGLRYIWIIDANGAKEPCLVKFKVCSGQGYSEMICPSALVLISLTGCCNNFCNKGKVPMLQIYIQCRALVLAHCCYWFKWHDIFPSLY